MTPPRICSITFALLGMAMTLPTHAGVGEDTAAAMQQNYLDTRADCDGVAAFACSGLLMRSVSPSARGPEWDDTPDDREKSAATFTYLRADSSRLGQDSHSGYTMAPAYQHPSRSIPYLPLCAYPANTAVPDLPGCTRQQDTPGKLCHSMGVTTAQQWLALARKNPQRPQCAFDIRKSHPDAAAHFQQSLLAGAELGVAQQIVFSTWNEAQPKRRPIQSFFHIVGTGGLANAQKLQRQWQEQTGRWVPIVAIAPPASFTYTPADQAVLISAPAPAETP